MAYWQLRKAGLSDEAIAYRQRMGRLHRVHRGVYAVGHLAPSHLGNEMAAVLAYGPDAVLSHVSAALRWGLLRENFGPIHITCPRRARARKGILVHTARLHPADRVRRDGIPITSVPRTLLDLASTASDRVVARAVNEAERAGWLTGPSLPELLRRSHGHRGSRRLRELTAGLDVSTWRTRSELEVEFLAGCRRAGIQPPLVNVRVEGYEVDMYWPQARLIVELDGFEYHRTRGEFERDRRRDAHLQSLGYRVLRVTWRWLTTDADGVFRTIRALLG